MSAKWKMRAIVVTLVLALVATWRLMAGGPPTEEKRQELYKALDAGN